MQSDILNLEILDELKSEFGTDTLLELLQLARDSATAELAALISQIEAGSDVKIRRIAHSLVGILGQYGGIYAARCAREAQTAPDDALVEKAWVLMDAGQAMIEALRHYAVSLSQERPAAA